MSTYPCPFCGAVSEVPCKDVFTSCVTEMIKTHTRAARWTRWLRLAPPEMAVANAVREQSQFLQDPVAVAALLVSDRVWHIELSHAQRHLHRCEDPLTCGRRQQASAVVQIDRWYSEQCVAGAA